MHRTMLIAHASDIHGSYNALSARPNDGRAIDLWILSGDILPTAGRLPHNNRIDRATEISHQHRWWGFKANSIMIRLDGKPVVVINGNHDFVNLAKLLRVSKYSGQIFDLSEGAATFGGQTFAGFREIPIVTQDVEPEWVGETAECDFVPIVNAAFAQDPTILVTHAPPSGIMDDARQGKPGYGVSALTTYLTYRPHAVTHHFFGHCHGDGMQTRDEMGITFANSATGVQFVDVP